MQAATQSPRIVLYTSSGHPSPGKPYISIFAVVWRDCQLSTLSSLGVSVLFLSHRSFGWLCCRFRVWVFPTSQKHSVIGTYHILLYVSLLLFGETVQLPSIAVPRGRCQSVLKSHRSLAGTKFVVQMKRHHLRTSCLRGLGFLFLCGATNYQFTSILRSTGFA